MLDVGKQAAGSTRASLVWSVRSCVEIKFYGAFELNRRVVLHAIDARDACSIAWWCSFLTARQSQDGRAMVDFRTGFYEYCRTRDALAAQI